MTVIFEINNNICENCGKNCLKKYYHINISRKEKHLFCSKYCKQEWILEKIKKRTKGNN